MPARAWWCACRRPAEPSGLAGCSIEDFTGHGHRIDDVALATERVAAAAEAVDRPVNVLAGPGVPPVAELAEAGVRRVSVGGAFAFAALSALVEAAEELREQGTYGYSARSRAGGRAARRAFPGRGPLPSGPDPAPV